MARTRWRQRCAAHRTDGEACEAFAITGGTVCVKHGGAAPQVRRAAGKKFDMECIRRRVEADIARNRERRLDWWVSRIVWVAETTGRDPVDLTRELAGRGHLLWTYLPLGADWPAGLGPDDEPRL